MAPIQNPRGIPQGNNAHTHSLRLTAERNPGAGPQTAPFAPGTLFRWIHRQLERLSPSLGSYIGNTYEGGNLPWALIQESKNSFTGLSPRSGDGRGCFTCFIMDNDPRIRYEGQWNLNKSGFFTTHSSTTSGSKASLTFDGTGITVFGTVPASNTTVKPPTVVYRVDAAQPFTTTQPIANRDVSSQPLFSYAFGSQGEQHKIEIEILEAQAPFTLDKFFISPENTTRIDSDRNPDKDDDNDNKGDGGKGNPIQIPPTATTVSNPATNNTAGPQPSLGTSVNAGIQRTTRVLAILLGITSFFVVVLTTLLVLQYIRQRPRPRRKSFLSRPETLYTHFTSTDTILRNTPPSVIGSANYSRSDGTPSAHNRITLDHNIRDSIRELPPLPPKAAVNLPSYVF